MDKPDDLEAAGRRWSEAMADYDRATNRVLRNRTEANARAWRKARTEVIDAQRALDVAEGRQIGDETLDPSPSTPAA